MTEVWLHANRRVLLLALVPVVVLAGVGALLLGAQGVPRGLGAGCLGLASLLGLGLLRQMALPRIAYRPGEVLFYLKSRGSIAVPLDVVEAFFQGEGPAHLPGSPSPQTKTVNLVARLAQRETAWQSREVKAALGAWQEGYITIRGTWCEPITGEVIRRLNRRLREVKEAEPARGEQQSHA